MDARIYPRREPKIWRPARVIIRALLKNIVLLIIGKASGRRKSGSYAVAFAPMNRARKQVGPSELQEHFYFALSDRARLAYARGSQRQLTRQPYSGRTLRVCHPPQHALAAQKI